MDRPTWVLGSVALALVVGVGSFLGGMQYQKTVGGNAPTTATNAAAQAGSGTGGLGSSGSDFGGGQLGGGQRPDIGTVSAVNGLILTLQTFWGSNQTVNVASGTKITDGQSGNSDQLSDIKTGDRILVSGTTNSDGSVTAQIIQVNPSFGGRFRGQSGGGTGSNSSGGLGSGSSTAL